MENKPFLIQETPRWKVVNKPAGWLTIPGRGAQTAPVLSEWLRQQGDPIWVVHRLDLETSGLVLFARTPEDHQAANAWFEKREVKKTYHALCMGSPRAPIFKVNSPIEGKPSLTQIEVKEKFTHGFFAQISPQTGRRHQIRIHLSSLGNSIWGDVLYQGSKSIHINQEEIEVSRVALHASRLKLPTGDVFEAPFPSDFESWLHFLRTKGTRS